MIEVFDVSTNSPNMHRTKFMEDSEENLSIDVGVYKS